ncbi:ATP-binding protein [Paenibacillus larvae]
MASANSMKVEFLLDHADVQLSRFNHNPVLIVREEGQIIHVSTRFLQETGYSEKELIGQTIQGVVSVCSLPELWERLARSDQEPAPILHLRMRDGSLAQKICTLFSVKVKQKPSFLLLFGNPYKHTQLSLLQRFADAFLQDVNLGVLLIDTDFKLIDISEMACRVLGLSKKKIIRRSMDEIFASIPPQHRLVQRNILEGMVVRNHALSWTNNQKRFELLLDSNVLRDHEGQIVGAYLMFKDVTNLRSLEAQVQRSDRLAMIGQIAAGTAHEIRNPLTSIKGFLQMLNKSFTEQGMCKEKGFTDIMLAEIDRVNDLVNEFLLLSKPKHVVYKPVDLPSVIKGLLPIINNEAILHDVQLVYEPAISLPPVIADQELLKQVFLNICKNGIEAMANGGKLMIIEKVNIDEKRVNIEIRDNGPGIPVFVLDKIFDPFFTTKEQGTGLGLSVCQQIVHDMGGHIRVSSKGFGTTFTVSLPYP